MYKKEENISDIERLNIEAEIPVLQSIRNFSDSISLVDWFKYIGEDLSPSEYNIAQHYVNNLGFPETSIAMIQTWHDAALAAETFDMNDIAWEAEEQLRISLTQQTLQAASEEGVSTILSHMSAYIAEHVDPYIHEALHNADEMPDMFLNLAMGSVQKACHGAALVISAAHAEALTNNQEINAETIETHPLMLKFRLFETGHWPISIIGSSFNLF